MANKEHVALLKQGVSAWNQWREENKDRAEADLSWADLTEANLREADLTGADLTRANLHGAFLTRAFLTRAFLTKADLREADLREADLREADLREADLTGADLSWADLTGADLSWADLIKADLTALLMKADLIGAKLREADLTEANLHRANLTEANLTGANLTRALLTGADLAGADLAGADLTEANLTRVNLIGANLTEANLTEAHLGYTVLGSTLLAEAKSLETCRHNAPSTLDHATLEKSGSLPLSFLRGVGLPDTLIDYLPSLLNQLIQFFSCFISYSAKDQEFAERLHADLQNKGVRCWFAPHDLPIGAKILDAPDEAIRLRDKVLLILSEGAIASDWVEGEVITALEEERTRKRTILFPVRIDDAVMQTSEAWARLLRGRRHIGDFTRWKDHDSYQKSFERVLRDLKVEQSSKS